MPLAWLRNNSDGPTAAGTNFEKDPSLKKSLWVILFRTGWMSIVVEMWPPTQSTAPGCPPPCRSWRERGTSPCSAPPCTGTDPGLGDGSSSGRWETSLWKHKGPKEVKIYLKGSKHGFPALPTRYVWHKRYKNPEQKVLNRPVNVRQFPWGRAAPVSHRSSVSFYDQLFSTVFHLFFFFLPFLFPANCDARGIFPF